MNKIYNSDDSFWDDLKNGKFASMVKEAAKGKSLNNAAEVFNVLKPMFQKTPDVEQFFCIFLNSKNKVLAIEKLFSGSIDRAMIFPRELIKKVLEHQALSIIVAHNHPSGSTEPSTVDIEITKKLRIAMEVIDGKLHDHIIVGDGYTSFADSGLF